MKNENTAFKKLAATQGIVLGTVFAAAIVGSQSLGNILSPISAFLSAGILLFSYIKSERKNKITLILLFLSLACLTWGIADVLWAGFYFSGADPESSALICAIYSLTNLFILISLMIATVKKTKNWSMSQFYNDLVVMSLLTCVFVYIVFLDKDISILDTLIKSDFTSLFSLISNILIFIMINSLLFSRRSGKIPVFARIVASGIILFAITDTVYYYFFYKGLYIPNSAIDFAYALSLVIMAFGALLRIYKDKTSFDGIVFKNLGKKKTWPYLLIYPLINAILEMTNVIDTGFDLKDIATYLILIIVHTAFSRYIQLSAEYQELLHLEKDMNRVLEQRVDEKVEELTFLANHDTLTNHLNRRAFLKYTEEAIKLKRPQELLFLLFIDIDRFKNINDHFGHDIGDKVLIELSKRMKEWDKYGAVISRVGGDEFAILLIGNYSREEIEKYCHKLTTMCSKPIRMGDKVFSVTISVGIAMLSIDAYDVNSLMKNADLAMYYAKSQGYNRCQFFNSILCQEIDNKNKIAVILNNTDIERELELFYQPQFSLADNRLVGAEALIRWNSVEYGYVPPNIFIPISEEIGCIYKIGKWVIQTAAQQAAKWNREDMPCKFKVGINISPKQIEEEGIIDVLASIILKSGVNPACLDVEVTENSILSKEDKIGKMFKYLKEAGFSISIDDFGSGYSAFGYLSKYSFDRIKIDKSLVENISSCNLKETDIVKSIISMAKSLGIITIAEGVETQEQLDILKHIGCDQVQGYLLGRPVSADLFEQNYLSGL